MSTEKDMDYIEINEKLLESPIWKDLNSNRRVIFITVLLLANYKDEEIYLKDGTRYTVKKGQVLTSLDSLANECRVSRNVIYNALKFFEKVGFLHQEKHQWNTKNVILITVENCELYRIDTDVDIEVRE